MRTDAVAAEIQGLSHRYGSSMALDNISLTLPANCTIGLVGPDGVGKSTLLACIAGVKRLQEGSVVVLGGDVRAAKFRAEMANRVAFMPQGLGKNLYPTLSVLENIDFFARLYGQDAAERAHRIERLLLATGLAPFRDRPAGKLSGGMKQKLGLCCALIHEPELLILDEPTTGVDPLSRRQFWSLLDVLRQERPGMSVIVATAYMEEAARFDHLVAMDQGKVLISDTSANVLGNAATLEQAYIALLPPARRGHGGTLQIPPRQRINGAPAIEAHGLTCRFGDFVAVDQVDLQIEQGEIFGFLGSNGCGKTTTMKMLTGLLPISEGSASLLGQPVNAADLATRMKVGYMSQSFSLYQELTVEQNLALHARLYRLPEAQAETAVRAALERFELSACASSKPPQLSLGIRQRLQLAAACLHRPTILILDEPTSGVDPAARDLFWEHLVKLSREDHVTIFVSTHFMNEAERCDRISLMHHGRVLAVGTPGQLCEQQGANTLEDAFIGFLESANDTTPAQAIPHAPTVMNPETDAKPAPHRKGVGHWLANVWSFARRETMELRRDPIRLTFAILGPIILLVTAALSISFDIEQVAFSVLDRDRSIDSRRLIEQFDSSRYFSQQAPLTNEAQIDSVMRAHKAAIVIDIPPHYGRDLQAGQRPHVAFYFDGAIPFMAQTLQGYVGGVIVAYAEQLARSTPGLRSQDLALAPVRIEPRFRYNQEFRSIYASTPGLMMLALIIIPTMLTTLGVVREKELGSIINLYASPTSVGQFLLGKQLPYIGLAIVSYLSLLFLAIVLLQVPLKGSLLALSFGALCFVFATTALGLLVSAFFSSQVAAIFASSIICLIPTINFSGLLYPVSTLNGAAWWIAMGFPSSWFQTISLGAFTKALSLSSFLPMYAMLIGFGIIYLMAARVLVQKQEV